MMKYDWKCLSESVQKFIRNGPQCQTINLWTPCYVELHLEIPQTPMDFMSIDLIGLFETSTKGNQNY